MKLIKKGEGCECQFCGGDLCLYWDGAKNSSAFIDTDGNLDIQIEGKELSIKVRYCPMCGRKLNGSNSENE